MLFPKRLWRGIADGTISLAFRRWERPRARPGARHRTPVGIIPSPLIDLARTASSSLFG